MLVRDRIGIWECVEPEWTEVSLVQTSHFTEEVNNGSDVIQGTRKQQSLPLDPSLLIVNWSLVSPALYLEHQRPPPPQIWPPESKPYYHKPHLSDFSPALPCSCAIGSFLKVSFSLSSLFLLGSSLPTSSSFHTFPMDHVTVRLNWGSYLGVD